MPEGTDVHSSESKATGRGVLSGDDVHHLLEENPCSPPPLRSQSELASDFQKLSAAVENVKTPSAKVRAPSITDRRVNAGGEGNFCGGMKSTRADVLQGTLGKSCGAHLLSRNAQATLKRGPDARDSCTMDAASFQEEDDYESSVGSNPTVWEGHFPRKMMDLEWQFSCGPLRVPDAMRRHWERLHATNKQLIPQPKGGLLLLEEHIPHKSDDDMKNAVLTSGVAKKKHERVLPPLPLQPPPDTPRMRKLLEAATVRPLPQKPCVDMLALVRAGPRRSGTVEGDSAADECTSVFSTTTVSKACRASPSLASVVSNKSKGSKASRSSTSTSSAAVSVHSRKGSQSGASSLKSHRSAATASRLSALETKIDSESREVATCVSEVQRAKRQLELLERMLSTRR